MIMNTSIISINTSKYDEKDIQITKNRKEKKKKISVFHWQISVFIFPYIYNYMQYHVIIMYLHYDWLKFITNIHKS